MLVFWNLILAMTVTGWIGIAYSIRVQIMRYRDLEYNLASRTLGTPTLKIVTKNILPQLVSVIVTTTTQLLPAFISTEAFPFLLWIGIADYSSKFRPSDFRLFTKRNDQCVSFLDSIDSLSLGILVILYRWTKPCRCQRSTYT